KKHFASFGHQQDAFILPAGEFFRSDGFGIAIAEGDLPALLRRNLRGERDLGAALLNAILIAAEAADVGRVGQHAPGNVFELVPLLQKVIAAVVTDGFDMAAVADANL